MADNGTAAAKTIKTVWEVWTYDVWGNAEDGYEVNDRTCIDRAYEVELPILTANVGTSHAFQYAELTDEQVKEALGLEGKVIETDGDDVTIDAVGGKTGKPYGQLTCVSHESLSPIREVENMAAVVEAQRNIRY